MLQIGTRFKFKPVTINSYTWIVDVVFEFDWYIIRCLEDLGVSKSVKIENLNTIEIITNNKTETNMERNLKLTIEQAQKLYKEQPSMRELLLTTFTKEELEGVVLKDWYELSNISGCYLASDSRCVNIDNRKAEGDQKNIFATEKQVKSALAMAQLSQLMKDLGDECNVDWGDLSDKHCILRACNHLSATSYKNTYHFLAFKTAKVRDAFLKKHEQLIKDYFMI